MMSQSPSKQAPWDLTQFSQLPSAAPSYFPESHWWAEISSLSKGEWWGRNGDNCTWIIIFFLKVILVWGKARSHSTPNLGYSEAESPVWFDILPKLCTRHDAWVDMLLWRSCQSPVAHSCSLLNHLNSLHGRIFKLNTKFDADSLLYSVILNVMATQDMWSLNGIYCPQ